jgi:hypothetical protein
MRFARAAVAAALVAACSTAQPVDDVRPDRNVISLEDIRATREDDAYDVVRKLHPTWLRKRGNNTIRDDGDVVIYLNDSRVGGPEQLRQMSTLSITSIRYYDPGQAQYRFGAGHQHGAIQVSTRVAIEKSGD